MISESFHRLVVTGSAVCRNFEWGSSPDQNPPSKYQRENSIFTHSRPMASEAPARDHPGGDEIRAAETVQMLFPRKLMVRSLIDPAGGVMII